MKNNLNSPAPLQCESIRVPAGSVHRKGRQCFFEFWQHFSYARTAKESEFGNRLIYKFVSLSLPGNQTNRDVVEQIAGNAHIPIESLCNELADPVFPRAQAIFGFAGDEFDRIADAYDNMQWWISHAGLNMAIVSPSAGNLAVPTFAELVDMQVLDGTTARSDVDQATVRGAWLDLKCREKGWTSDLDIQNNGGPTYNTVQRYRRGIESTRDRYVRQRLARTFGCDFSEVPS